MLWCDACVWMQSDGKQGDVPAWCLRLCFVCNDERWKQNALLVAHGPFGSTLRPTTTWHLQGVAEMRYPGAGQTWPDFLDRTMSAAASNTSYCICFEVFMQLCQNTLTCAGKIASVEFEGSLLSIRSNNRTTHDICMLTSIRHYPTSDHPNASQLSTCRHIHAKSRINGRRILLSRSTIFPSFQTPLELPTIHSTPAAPFGPFTSSADTGM